MQSFPPEPNITTDFTRPPHLAAFSCDHTVVISFTWKILYNIQKIVNYDWRYKDQRLGGTLRMFVCLFGQDIVIGGMLCFNVKSNLLLPSRWALAMD